MTFGRENEEMGRRVSRVSEVSRPQRLFAGKVEAWRVEATLGLSSVTYVNGVRSDLQDQMLSSQNF